MTHILALLNKPTGRGSFRCWSGFLFDTIVQSEVEQFMEMVHQPDYFLVDPSKLERNKVGNLIYTKYWVMETIVKVQTKGINTTFMLKN